MSELADWTMWAEDDGDGAVIEAAVKAERERCAKIANTMWLSALVDLEQFGIGNADREMELCYAIEAAIRGETQ